MSSELFISLTIVKSHGCNIFGKVKVNSR
ncbi:MAG: hypothetical protein JJE03_05600 [Peptostreptococcaceae bacterium]|nr:hypothetical protein [Peptostreptococcaceae bacterium]